jgi:site-specific DNA-methyltransferase (adenine-specific)
LHDSYYAAVSGLRRRRVADRLRLECGDCLEVVPRLVAEGVVVDAIVTDPPYGLGFMGKGWDRGVPGPGYWRAVAAILRPGGYLVAFGGARTYHRLVCAIEDAGFVIQDQLAWLYGSGFPKRGDMLKPAHEPICLAYKPGGPRSLGVDECRIDGREQEQGNYAGSNVQVVGPRDGGKIYPQSLGRWPANVVHDGSAEVLAGFPESAAGVDNGERGRGGFWGASSGEPCGPQYGDSGSAARFFYSAKADTADRWGSRHPTVKPIDLIRWLVTLVVPPGGIFLDPFAGSGTAAVAALASGRDAILIERDPGYVADIRERIAHYAGEGRHSLVAKGRARREPAAGSLL